MKQQGEEVASNFSLKKASSEAGLQGFSCSFP